jgi:2-polyprenyl-3-methyl-5-hydroxy-6-metoxy-1,4-benzoquinol methylase
MKIAHLNSTCLRSIVASIMQVVRDLNALDAKLAECDAALKISDDELRKVFSSFRMDISREVPSDPFSDEYRDFQMALYQRLHGRAYDVAHEATPFDVAAADRRPFPYYTNSCKTAGFFTMGVGFLLHCLDLPAGSRVMEFGPGWGNSTIAMALTGLKVTAIDIEQNFCRLLELRAKRHDVDVDVVCGDFSWAETVTEPFDAAVFFECFHHCADHMRLLRALQRAIKPGGKIYFAAEPITRDFPVPWGLRGDGESLWAIRRHGWLELGFNERYFEEALARTGWIATKKVYHDIGWAAVWIAERINEAKPATAKVTEALPGSASLRQITASLRRRLKRPLRAHSTLFSVIASSPAPGAGDGCPVSTRNAHCGCYFRAIEGFDRHRKTLVRLSKDASPTMV